VRAFYNSHLALSTPPVLLFLLFLQISCRIKKVCYGKIHTDREERMAAGNNVKVKSTKGGTCEVVVVGAGLVGAALVANLVAEGLDVAVLEARDRVGGSAGTGTGLVATGLPIGYAQTVERYGRDMARSLWELTVENRTSLLLAADRLGIQVERPGSLTVAVGNREAEQLESSADMLVEDGFDVVFEVKDPLDRGFSAALRAPDDVVVDGASLAQRIFDTYEVPVHTGAEVYRLEQEKEDVLVVARGRAVRANTVVLAVNGYAPLVDTYFGDKIAPVRGIAFTTHPLEDVELPLPGNKSPFCFRQMADGRLRFTACTAQYETPAAGPEDERVEVDMMRFVGRHFPEAGGQFARRESSIMGASRDALPLIGALPHLPQVFFAVGFAGYGLSLAFAAADLLTGLIVRGAEPSPLSARRLE
jgi:glycine/D-amino acid oxidase-like deaminating enzyme